jgi:hypothetical protein
VPWPTTKFHAVCLLMEIRIKVLYSEFCVDEMQYGRDLDISSRQRLTFYLKEM